MRSYLKKISAALLILAMLVPSATVIFAEEMTETREETGADRFRNAGDGQDSTPTGDEALGDGISSSQTGNEDPLLAMKLRVNYCLREGSRAPIYLADDGTAYGAPAAKDGEVLVPLAAVASHIGYTLTPSADGGSFTLTGGNVIELTVGESRAVVDGGAVELCSPVGYLSPNDKDSYPVINMNDVERLFDGWFVSYDALGLILISTEDNLFSRDNKNSYIKELMISFVFDFPKGEDIARDVEENTNGFDHPYLLADEETWQKLKSIYEAEEGDADYNREIKRALQVYVTYSEGVCNKYESSSKDAEADEYGWRGFDPEKKPTNPYRDNGGYDVGGRLAEIEDYAGELIDLAIAYRVTGKYKYLLCGYDLLLALGEWEHWGHGHTLNCADAASEIALYFDWAYDGNIELGLDVERLATIIYEKSVYWGKYITDTNGAGLNFNYPKMTNNWNAVCTSGMALAALSILEFDQYRDTGADLIASNMQTLVYNGMDPYLDEGTYIEGAAYWGYATNVYYLYCAALDSAAGTNYGMMDLWGMDITNYYACHTESSDQVIFNYSDADPMKQCTYFFFYASRTFDDPVLSAVRLVHIENGKNLAIYDMLYYPFDGVPEVELPLDYFAPSVALYTARSGWERGALFIGTMAGKNNTPHGHLDGGSFVYHNHKNVWIADIGTENYNVYGYWWDNYRYRYYRTNPEGHNTLCLVSDPSGVPLGQVLNANCPVAGYEANDHGSYVTYNMTEAFGKNAVSWNRGIMLTNDRQTVVVQDQVQFDGPQTVYWFAHYYKENLYDLKMSDDGRTVYMIGWPDGKERAIRLTLVGGDGLRFTLMDCYTLVNTGSQGTYTPSQVTAMGLPEHSRDKISKLAVKGENILSFNVAVVIESVSLDREIEVGYKWRDMVDWTPTEDVRKEYYERPEEVPTRGEPKLSSITSSDRKCTRYLGDGTAYGRDLPDHYRALTDLVYAFSRLPEAQSAYAEQYARLLERRAAYDTFAEGTNLRMKEAGEMVRGIMPARFGE